MARDLVEGLVVIFNGGLSEGKSGGKRAAAFTVSERSIGTLHIGRSIT